MTRSTLVGGLALSAAIGLVMPLLMYGSRPALAIVVLAALVVVLPTFVLNDARPYWLAIFLFSLQFDIKKNLVDGLRVLEALQIDYMQFVFTPELRLSDLPFAILLARWAHDVYTRKQRLEIPRTAGVAVAYLAWATLSALLKASSVYLAAIELIRQCKFLIVFLYAANCLGTKRLVRLALVVLMTTLAVQGVVTAGRYQFKYFESFESLLGVQSRMEAEDRLERLKIDTEEAKGMGYTEARRSFGTLPSPASTGKYCLLVAPIALLFTLRPRSRAQGATAAASFLSGAVSFYLTYARAPMVGYLVGTVLGSWYAVRRRYVPRSVVVIGAVVALSVVAVVTPKLYTFMANRADAVAVRFIQYEAALRIISDNPVLGVGINNSAGVQERYTDESYFLADPLRQSMTQPIHSFYLTLVAETGIPGFVLYLAFFLVTIGIGRRLSWTARDPEIALFATIAVVGIAGLAVGVIMDPLFEDSVQTILWLYAGMIVALRRLDRDDARALVAPAAAQRSRVVPA